jgi:flagellin-like protein
MKKTHKEITWQNMVKSNIPLYVLLIILSCLCIPLIVLIMKFKVISGIYGALVVFGITLVLATGFLIGMKNLLNALSKLHNT